MLVFFVIIKNVWKKMVLLCIKKSQDYKFYLKYLHLVRSNKKLLYLKECDHISSLKKEKML